MDINVENSVYVRTNTINKVIIRISSIELFKNIKLIAQLYENTTYIDSKIIVISGPDYDMWGNDDKYIINYVLDKLEMREDTTVITSE